MGYRGILDRVGELEALLKAPQIKTSLNFLRLHYISTGELDDSKKCEDLQILIAKNLEG